MSSLTPYVTRAGFGLPDTSPFPNLVAYVKRTMRSHYPDHAWQASS